MPIPIETPSGYDLDPTLNLLRAKLVEMRKKAVEDRDAARSHSRAFIRASARNKTLRELMDWMMTRASEVQDERAALLRGFSPEDIAEFDAMAADQNQSSYTDPSSQ